MGKNRGCHSGARPFVGFHVDIGVGDNLIERMRPTNPVQMMVLKKAFCASRTGPAILSAQTTDDQFALHEVPSSPRSAAAKSVAATKSMSTAPAGLS